MVQLEHPNSRPITIFRAGSFLVRAQGKEIEEYFQMSKQGIGSYWEGGQSNKVGSNLSFEEQKLLMPHLINFEPDDRTFRQEVDNFFHEIDTKVPHGTGVVLETGLKENNDKPLSKTNMPLDISDFIKWRHALRHPKVGISKKESDSSPLKEYYIFDPLSVQNHSKKENEAKDSAMQMYLQLKKEPEKIDMVLTLMGVDPRSFSGPHKDDDKLARLRKFSEEEPIKFSATYKQEDLTSRYWIENMVNVGILTKIGSKYINTNPQATTKILGHNIEEVLLWFSDPESGNEVVMLKAQMQEAQKKPIIKGNLKTELTAKNAAHR